MNSRLTVAAGLVLVASLAGAQTRTWAWNEGDDSYNNDGGKIKRISSYFNATTNDLAWHMTFGEVPSSNALKTDGFWLVLSDGPNPKGFAGQLAIFYLDVKNAANPVLTVYGYNGLNSDSSYKDGSQNAGIQAPDKIASSIANNSFVQELTVVNNGDGTRTLGFTVNTNDSNQNIKNHVPLYPETSPWEGAQYGSKIGVWVHQVAGLNTSYGQDGFLTNFSYQKAGWLDLQNKTTTPVPEPFTMGILGLGAYAVTRLRRKSA